MPFAASTASLQGDQAGVDASRSGWQRELAKQGFSYLFFVDGVST
jgi:hypothetical protein